MCWLFFFFQWPLWTIMDFMWEPHEAGESWVGQANKCLKDTSKVLNSTRRLSADTMSTPCGHSGSIPSVRWTPTGAASGHAVTTPPWVKISVSHVNSVTQRLRIHFHTSVKGDGSVSEASRVMTFYVSLISAETPAQFPAQHRARAPAALGRPRRNQLQRGVSGEEGTKTEFKHCCLIYCITNLLSDM